MQRLGNPRQQGSLVPRTARPTWRAGRIKGVRVIRSLADDENTERGRGGARKHRRGAAVHGIDEQHVDAGVIATSGARPSIRLERRETSPPDLSHPYAMSAPL
jgi:hypothetical protein